MKGFIPVYDKEGCRIVQSKDIAITKKGATPSLSFIYSLLGIDIVEALALSPDHRVLMDEVGLYKGYDYGFKVRNLSFYSDPKVRAKVNLPPVVGAKADYSVDLVGSICIVQLTDDGDWSGFDTYEDAYAYCTRNIEVHNGKFHLMPKPPSNPL